MEGLSWDNLWLVYGAYHTPLCSSLLVMEFTHREPRSFSCLSTTVLDPLASLKDPKLWKKVRSTSASTTNGSLFSGCRKISHRLVAIPTRYVRAIFPFLSASQSVIGHRFWTKRGSNVCIPSLPQRRFFNCCPSCCTPYSLTH